MTPDDKHWLERQFSSVGTKIETVETKLLTTFHDWTSVADVKLSRIPEVELRLQILEKRVRNLELGRKPPR